MGPPPIKGPMKIVIQEHSRSIVVLFIIVWGPWVLHTGNLIMKRRSFYSISYCDSFTLEEYNYPPSKIYVLDWNYRWLWNRITPFSFTLHTILLAPKKLYVCFWAEYTANLSVYLATCTWCTNLGVRNSDTWDMYPALQLCMDWIYIITCKLYTWFLRLAMFYGFRLEGDHARGFRYTQHDCIVIE